nr:immunoglobulin light chain junction region [Macaca mulatta]
VYYCQTWTSGFHVF